MTSLSSAASLNPDTYLNHLSPQEAREYDTTRNVLLVLLGVTVWDILATLPDQSCTAGSFSLFYTLFHFSRCFALAYVISNVIRRTTSIYNLHAAILFGGISCGLSVGCSSYLFLQRIFAVYADSPRVRRFFTILWMTDLFFTFLIIYSIKPAYIPETQHFKDSGIQPLLSLTLFVIIIYDSSVYLAISYKIGIAHVVIDREMGWKRFILGRALPRLSQGVLRGSQQYYL